MTALLPQDSPAAWRPPTYPWRVLAVLALLQVGLVAALHVALYWQTRQQLAERDAVVLHALARQQVEKARDELDDLGVEAMAADLIDLERIALDISDMPGLLGIAVTGARGDRVAAYPVDLVTEAAPPTMVGALREGRPLARLDASVPLAQLFGELPTGVPPTGPVLHVWVPLAVTLRDGTTLPLGLLHFLIDGTDLQATTEATGQQLLWQAVVLAGGGALVLCLVLGWGWRRQLADWQRLHRAHAELALALKMAAVGTVTAHLLHGLKNPLSGLRAYVADTVSGLDASAPADRVHHGEDRREALAAAARMGAMIDEVASLLREAALPTEADSALTPADLAPVLRQRLTPVAQQRHVTLMVEEGPAAPALAPVPAQLLLLVLTNLAQNGLEASRAGQAVSVRWQTEAGVAVAALVGDAGPGLPAMVVQRLGLPVPSTKEGGSGLGLALSHALAQQMGGRLEIAATGPTGTTWRVVLPAAAPSAPSG